MTEEIATTEGSLEPIAEPSKVQVANLTNAGLGRKKGKPNRLTKDMRTAAAFIIDKKRDRFIAWIDRVGRKDPGRACELYIRLLQTYAPRPTFEAQLASSSAPGEPTVLAMRIRQVLEAPVP